MSHQPTREQIDAMAQALWFVNVVTYRPRHPERSEGSRSNRRCPNREILRFAQNDRWQAYVRVFVNACTKVGKDRMAQR